MTLIFLRKQRLQAGNVFSFSHHYSFFTFGSIKTVNFIEREMLVTFSLHDLQTNGIFAGFMIITVINLSVKVADQLDAKLSYYRGTTHSAAKLYLCTVKKPAHVTVFLQSSFVLIVYTQLI